MTVSAGARANVIEPLDIAKHDRNGFSCGVEQVDNFFRQTANKLSKANNLRTFVMASPQGDLIGFYAINAHAVHYMDLPKKFARSRPSHGNIPAAYISMIGVDARYQGSGYGGDLLIDCLIRLLQAANVLGIAVVILDVLDCGDDQKLAKRRALYEGYGFQAMPSNPLRLFLPVETIRKLVGASA